MIVWEGGSHRVELDYLFYYISIYHIPALFDKFLLSTFTQKLCDSLVALDAIQIQSYL